ncbi:MAG: Stp1/IreP family PP2C-type Ser/Thr phosphatase [Candidatus Aminicenantes bacterium]|nr:MAG: Stp1/IreP family PP2C-type Ser/Thr phosphatase [Candidatus Aminicenantes bacterium]
MRIHYFGKSDRGQVRQSNEDYFAAERIKEKEYLFVVADGMGGHRAGDVASKLGTQNFIRQYKKLRKKKNSIMDSMNRALEKANSVILAKATSDPQKRGMGTTFSAVVISSMKAYIVHVGDSRIYLLRDDHILQLTTDHTFVGKMLEEGRITEDEARDHPQKNILYMSLGARKTFEPEIKKQIDLQAGDIFIICSDGLNNMVSDGTIKEYVLSYSPDEAVEELIRLANDNGGTDNITLQVVQVETSRKPEKTEPIPIVKEKNKIGPFIKKFFKRQQPEEK